MEKSKWALCNGLLLWSMLCPLVHTQTLSTPLAPCSLADIDRDDDGLIEICDLEALDAIRYQLDGSGYRADAAAVKITAGCSVGEGCKGYELVKDLDFNDDASYRQIEHKEFWTSRKGWQPIGDFLHRFSAVLKGNKHTISNLHIYRNIDSLGLFSRLHSDAEIDGLMLSNVDIKGGSEVGALVGFNEGNISNSGVAGGDVIGEGSASGGLVGVNHGVISNSSARINLTGMDRVGGMVGDNGNWVINSYASGRVIGAANDVGGLVGHNSGSLINNYATSNIKGEENNVGGLIGHNNGSLTNSYARGYVRGLVDNVGGLVGLNNGIVANAYVTGSEEEAHDVQGRYRVGGLVGYNKDSITDSYATASVIGLGYAGSLIGLNYVEGKASESTATNSYWNRETSRITRSAGGVFRTTEQLQSPTVQGNVPGQVYYNWNTSDWDFGTERHYPALKYAQVPDSVRGPVACVAIAGDDPTLVKCGDLLRGQYSRLSDLVLADGWELFPAFDPEVFHYRVAVDGNTEQLRLTPRATDHTADISIFSDGGFSRDVDSGTLSVIPLNASMDISLIRVARQYKINIVYPLKVKGIPLNNTVNEGDRIRLEVSRKRGSDARPVRYDWVQLSGVPLLSGIDTQQSVLEIEVPEDLVARTAGSTDVVLQVQVSDETITESREITLTIVKANNGSSSMPLAAPVFMEETFKLIIPELNTGDTLRDPDGIENLDMISYQWQIKSPAANAVWLDIKDATGNSYDIPISLDIANHTEYRVRVNYRDGQGYPSNSVVSEKFVLPVIDIDRDDDGLIEIHYLEDLSAMRYQRDGSAYAADINAPKITKGCPASICIGYELARDLDFNDDGSYRDLSNKRKWAEFGSWQHISSVTGNNPFTAIFEGNNRTISNLKIRSARAFFTSLFGYTSGVIMNLGLLNVDVIGGSLVGGLAGANGGVIANCYVIGRVASVGANDASFNLGSQIGGLVGLNTSLSSDPKALIINSYASVNAQGNARSVGGLVGINRAMIINSYATGSVKGDSTDVGGLVGFNGASGTILNGYVRGIVEGKVRIGGLVGHSDGTITHSFATAKVSGSTRVGGLIGNAGSDAQVIGSYWDSLIGNTHYSAGGTSKTTVELQASTAGESTTKTGTYYKWSNDDWDFGSDEQYPILKYVQFSDMVQVHTACVSETSGDATLPICGSPLSDRQYGLLAPVILAEGNILLSPGFSKSIINYELIIAGEQDWFSLIPTAIDPDARIDIIANGRIIDKNIKSGTTSSEILLDSEDVTQIIIEVKGKLMDRYIFNANYIPFADLDEDDDGLIEIRKLEDLNAVRYNLYGTAYKAGPNAAETTIGCPSEGCKGYELITDLDFFDDTSYRRIANKTIWTGKEGWQPIGSMAQPFAGVFKGNINAIHNLMINRPDVDDVGLFGALGSDAEIDGVGLLNIDMLGKLRVGGLVGANLTGIISNSYVDGEIKAEGGTSSGVGGLVGYNGGVVRNSYAISHVVAKSALVPTGGLVGSNMPGSLISDSYTISRVEGGNDVGGLVGTNSRAVITQSYAVAFAVTDDLKLKALVGNNDMGSISSSYWDITVAEIEDTMTIDSIASGAIGLTTKELKSSTASGSTSTKAYFNWRNENWDFGTSEQYPILKYNHPSCNNPIIPPCNTVFSDQSDNRLHSLTFSEGVGLVPAFESLIFTYDMYVSADINLIKLTPAASMPTFITLHKDGKFFENIRSGTSSSPILLGEEIKVAVEDSSSSQYTIKVHLLDTIAGDIDQDNDGLIEVSNLEELNEIRYQPDGTGYRESATAPKITIGCPASGCKGYELDRGLDFEDIASYRNAHPRDLANKDAWTRGEGWQPIENFNSIFKANNKTLSNLNINRPTARDAGLFADVGDRATIEGVALLNVDLMGSDRVGSLAGSLKGRIINSYATGTIAASGSELGGVGGLVGVSTGYIAASYAQVNVSASAVMQKLNSSIGGLVGKNGGIVSNSYAGGDVIGSRDYIDNVGGLIGSSNGTVNNAYAIGEVSGNYRISGLVGNNAGTINNGYSIGNVAANTEGGGLAGRNGGVIINSYTISPVSLGSNGALIGKNDNGSVEQSYWNTDISGQRHSAAGTSVTTVQLKSPVAPGRALDEVYFNWSAADWDFGTRDQYPALRYKDDNCSTPQALPNCGALLFNQRFGLRDLELSAGTMLFPEFAPEIFSYDITLDADQPEFSLIATLVNFDDSAALSADDAAGVRITSGARSPLITADSSHIAIEVEAKNGKAIVYTFEIHRLAFSIIDIDKDDDSLIEINNLEGLNAIRYQLDGRGYRENLSAPLITKGCPAEGCKGYELAKDLDFKDNQSYRDASENKKTWTEGEGWEPIGSEQDAFNGIFKGNGKTLSNLTVNRPDSDNLGLFGSIGRDAKIEDLGVLNSNLAGNNKAGSLAGASDGVIVNSYATGRVEGQGSKIGGLVGENSTTGTIINSYARIRVSGTHYIGGLVGINTGRISNCYAISSVEAKEYGVGGLVGENHSTGTIVNNYAISDVVGTSNAGGFIGRNADNGKVENNYAVSSVIGNGSDIGGFIGVNGNDGILSNNYWDMQKSNITEGIAGSTAYNTADLQTSTSPTETIYIGWSTDVWDFGSDEQYPILKYTTGTNVASVFRDNPACGASLRVRCGVPLPAQDVGLVDLKLLLKGFNFSPNFNRTISDYRLTIFSDIKHIRLLPLAYASDADIRISTDKAFTEHVASATTSSAISLNADGTTLIAVEVQTKNNSAVRYSIAVQRLGFTVASNRIDSDGDGLIEINYLEDLHATRYQLDGLGYRVSSTASMITKGCPTNGCRGYELAKNLDFEDDESYRDATASKGAWILNKAWLPIGSEQDPFIAMFNGNHKTLSGLRINRPDATAVGLFGMIGSDGRISNLSVSANEIVGGNRVGTLAGSNKGVITGSHTFGNVVGSDKVGGLIGENLISGAVVNSNANNFVRGANSVGAFVGFNEGRIAACYAIGNAVATGERAGGFVGHNFGGSIDNSYAIGDVTGVDSVGGFIGSHELGKGGVAHSYAIGNVLGEGQNMGGFGGINDGGVFTHNYWNIETSGRETSIAGSRGFNTRMLQSPITPSAAIYVAWDTNVWDFGTSAQYPSLKYISGADVAEPFKAKPACGSSAGQPMCNTELSDQYIGLVNLESATEGFELSSPFEASLHDYHITVFDDTRAIQLIATAYDVDSIIRIRSDIGFNEVAASATTSSAIALHTTRSTVVTIAAQKHNGTTVLYTIKVSALDFTISDNQVDKDGNGLIEIHYLEDLNAIRYQLDGNGYRASSATSMITAGCPASGCKGYELVKNLNFENNENYRAIANKKAWTLGEGWQPIGTEQHPFTALFNGNHKTLSDLLINRPETDAVALFGVIGTGSRISNVSLSDIKVIGNNKVSSLVGMSRGVIVNSHARGDVAGQHRVGGLIGENNATIVSSYADVDATGEHYVGALVGFNEGNITGCYAKGNVVGENHGIGGFAGINVGGVIQNNYATGDVKGGSHVGGFVGSNSSRGEISNNYAIGRVRSESQTLGGFAGANTGIVFSGNYWNIQTSEMKVSVLANIGFNTAELKSLPNENVYADWDSMAWHFEAGEYPHLKHVKGIAITNLPSDDVACSASSEPVCGTLLSGQRIGLANLEIVSEGLNLLPEFDNTVLDYKVTAYADTNSIRLIPSIYSRSAIHKRSSSLRLDNNRGFNDIIIGGDGSFVIPLNTSDTTTITIDVQTENDLAFQYTIKVEYLDFIRAGEQVDRDGDGLIEINYVEDLHAIRYQLDGSGYRVSPTASKITAGCAASGCIGYELGQSLDFKDHTSYRDATNSMATWIEGKGWLPIGSEKNPFSSRFNGNGYTISNLIINRPQTDNVALFATLSDKARIDNVVLSDVDIKAMHKVGSLVATNKGIIERSRTDGSIAGHREVGGMVGHNAMDAKIITSFAATLSEGKERVGGLVGENQGLIQSSYARGNVAGYAQDGNSTLIGGLAGYNDNQIVNSFAINDVSGSNAVGGLVGANNEGQIIINSYAMNTVNGTTFVGGLAGRNENNAKIVNSYADSKVLGGSSVGGLVGFNLGTMNNSYASGSVSGGRRVGGLAGANRGAISNSYTIALVAGRVDIGALAGVGDSSLITQSYWDSDVISMRHSAGGKGFSTSELQTPINVPDIPSLAYYQWSTKDWDFGDANQYPMLRYALGSDDISGGCGALPELPNCESRLLPYGLQRLEILEASQLSPSFEFSHFDYRVDLNQGEPHIHLIPIAFASDAEITIKVDGSLHAKANSGNASPPVALHQSGKTVITLEIAGMVYNLTTAYLPVIDTTKDIDDDDDGLIEINYLEDLNAIRYQLDGTAYKAGVGARRITTGCAAGGCFGYELVRDLDFTLDESYRDPQSNKAIWASQHDWIPIGSIGRDAFSGLLKGNGYSISNLIISKQEFNSVGLFSTIADNAEIDGIGLLNFDVRGFSLAGSLVGWNKGGKITNSYVSGNVSARDHVGELVGRNTGMILNSYASGQVSGDEYIGGLAGNNQGNIINSYAESRITGRIYGGGLVGLNQSIVKNSYTSGSIQLDSSSAAGGLIGFNLIGEVTNSYWDTERSRIEAGTHGEGFGSEALKSPTAAGIAMGNIYHGWNHQDWDFGSTKHYPALKYTNDSNTLLPYQRDGLQSLALPDGAMIFPNFNPHVFDYHIVVPIEMQQIQLRATAYNPVAMISIDTEDFIDERLTPMIVTVPLNQTSASHIALSVKTDGGRQVSYRFAIYYSPLIEIESIPGRVVDEGQHIRLIGSHHLDKGLFDYLWTQISGPPLLSEAMIDQAILDFTVPMDLVPRSVDYIEAVFRLQISFDDLTLNRDLLLIINKHNNGPVREHFAAPVLRNSELTLSVELASDPDGVGNLDAIAYQWQSLAPAPGAIWRDIEGASEEIYKIPASMLDSTRYRVLINYVDKQGYIHQNIASKAFTAIDIDKDNDGLIEIRDRQDLDAIRYVLDGSGYRQSITATTSTVGCPVTGCIGYELTQDLYLGGTDWQPIGTEHNPYAGIFNGNHHIISNLNIRRNRNDAVGLFGVTASTAEISGIGLSNVYVAGRGNVGGVVGINKGIVVDSYIIKSVIVGSAGGIGGLVGSNDGGIFSGIVADSYADVDVSVTFEVDGIVNVGGLVGTNINGGKISNSYARGSIVGYCRVGGLVGYNGGMTSKISNGYAAAQVAMGSNPMDCGTSNLKFAGGLVGYNDKATVENSYAIGRVSGIAEALLGGLAGGSYSDKDIASSYWDVTTSGVQTDAGGTSKTTVQLQSPAESGSTASEVYYRWSDADWDFGSDEQYPALKYSHTNRACGLSGLLGCELLLLQGQSQSSGLRQLTLLNEATLVPSFHPRIFAYRIASNQSDIELILIMENLNMKGRISKNGILIKEAITGERVLIPLEGTTTTVVTIDLVDQNERPTRYKLYVNHVPEAVISNTLNGSEAKEGMRVGVDGTGSRDADEGDLLHYSWEQLSGPPVVLDKEAKETAHLEFTVPDDFVGKANTSSEVVLRLTVDDGAASASEDISIRIKKINNGSVSIADSKFISAFAISAPEIELSKDPDGMGVESDISYQWQEKVGVDWRDITHKINKVYSLEPDTANHTLYRVQLSYIDGQGYISTTFSKAISFIGDLDRDDDGLIEIGNLEELDAIRYALNGTGYREDTNSDVSTTGCPMSQCRGYELTRDLDFLDVASYRNPTADKFSAWQPIANVDNLFDAVFDGNGYTISNLTIRSDSYDVGLFGAAGSASQINNIGLLNVDIRGGENVGGIVGTSSRGMIRYSYVHGKLTVGEAIGGLVGTQIGGVMSNSYASVNIGGGKSAGGLIGSNLGGRIDNSHSRGDIEGEIYAGGLAGFINTGIINNSYTTGKVSSDNNAGGLIGAAIKSPVVINSYWNADKNGAQSIPYGIGFTTAQLQRPTAPGTTETEIYYDWSTSDWDFGDESQHPALKGIERVLLSYQRIGLFGLELIQPSKLSPNFDSRIYNYDVTVVAGTRFLRLLPTAKDTDIFINDFKVESGTLSSPISLSDTTATVITIRTIQKNAASVSYTLNVNNNFPQATITVMPHSQLDEGDHIALDVTSEDPNGDSLIYSWSQKSGTDLLSGMDKLTGVIKNQNNADLSFNIPENLLTAEQSDSKAELNLSIDDGKASVNKKIVLRIIKKNNGSIPGLSSPRLQNLIYVAPTVDTFLSQDPDGAANPNTIGYQWQKYERGNWFDINGEIGTSYTPQAAEINQQYRVFVSYADNQGHQDGVASQETVFRTSEKQPTSIFIHIRVFPEGLLAE